jgi:thioredoxin 1
MMIQVTDDSFVDDVLKAELPTLVDFWAEWCGPCKMIAPIVEALAEEYTDQLKVVKMDVDSNMVTPSQLGIMGIPTLILFKDGEEVTRLVGYRPQNAIEEAIKPYLDQE